MADGSVACWPQPSFSVGQATKHTTLPPGSFRWRRKYCPGCGPTQQHQPSSWAGRVGQKQANRWLEHASIRAHVYTYIEVSVPLCKTHSHKVRLLSMLTYVSVRCTSCASTPSCTNSTSIARPQSNQAMLCYVLMLSVQCRLAPHSHTCAQVWEPPQAQACREAGRTSAYSYLPPQGSNPKDDSGQRESPISRWYP